MKNEDIFRELGNLDPDLILKAAPEEAHRAAQWTPFRRLLACAAALALVVGLLLCEPVYAAVRELFSFVPGVGIHNTEELLYTYQSVVGRVESGDMEAQILLVSYEDGILRTVLRVAGKNVDREDLRMTVNGQVKEMEAPSLYHAPEDSEEPGKLTGDCIAEIPLRMMPPAETDRFEVQISDFEAPLVFTVKVCETFEELQQIGPTATQNGISVTVTTEQTGRELVVWFYETRDDTATEDDLAGFGSPANGSNPVRLYVETESGAIAPEGGGWRLGRREVFLLGEGDETAVLHIPYLAMWRPEKAKFQVDLPADYGTFEGTAVVHTSLGDIRVVSMERRPGENGKDHVTLQLAYENKQEDQRMYSFAFEEVGGVFAMRSSETNGTMEFMEIVVERETQTVEANLSGLYYYLMGEYELELDIS